jgi:hypothetical protein
MEHPPMSQLLFPVGDDFYQPFIPSSNQTWFAGKSPVILDFPNWKPAFMGHF